MAMADRIAVMNFGKIQQIGTPKEIYEQPRNEFVAGFIGEPPMNFALCELVREDEQFILLSPSFRIGLGGRSQDKLALYEGAPQVKLGVRPEDVGIVSSPAKNTMAATVDFVEAQGDRTILIVKLADGEIFLVEVVADFRPDIGQVVHLQFDLKHIHIFEAQTGVNLLY
jgi:multiple sugar transport system ATP-binding protein